MVSLFALMCLIWGASWLAMKLGVASVPPVFFAGTRFLVAGLVMLLVAGLRGEVRRLACAAILMSLPWQLGALAAASAMAGECLSSFVKRRFGLEPSGTTLGLDQVPESLFPAAACSAYLPLGPLDVALIVLVFSVGELATSRLFFAVGLWDRPY
jgi:EamA-like transporter family/CDP-archaeol synthase